MQARPGPAGTLSSGVRAPAASKPSMQAAAVEDEDTETSKRRPPLALYAGIGGGALLVIVLLVMVFSSGGDTPKTPDPTAPAADSAGTPAVAAAGAIQLDVKPAAAKVTVDGTDFPGNTPRLLSNLAPGTHKLVVSQDGFLPFEQDVSLAAGQQLSLPVKLPVRDVTMTVSTQPAEATVKLVEGTGAPAPVGKGGESFKIVRKPGVAYKVVVEAAGYDANEVPLTFSGEPADTANVVLVKAKGPAPVDTPPLQPETGDKPKPTGDKPKPTGDAPKPKPKAKTAEVKIGAGPGMPPATVWVDGEKQAKPTPVVVMVSPGSHTIKWKYPDGKSFTKKISVTDGSSTIVKSTP